MVSLLSIIALGFFLGMRHATDPDHVIAVATIVSRQRSIRRSALIGVFWGLGHTLTILLVGAAIILFNLVIPPRIGLSMELSVALMLIVLGLMNVVSFLRSAPGVDHKRGDAPASTRMSMGTTPSRIPIRPTRRPSDGWTAISGRSAPIGLRGRSSWASSMGSPAQPRWLS